MRLIKFKIFNLNISNYIGYKKIIKLKFNNRFSFFKNRKHKKFLINTKLRIFLKRSILKCISKLFGYGKIISFQLITMLGIKSNFFFKKIRMRQFYALKKICYFFLQNKIFGKEIYHQFSRIFRNRLNAGTYHAIRLKQGLPFNGQRTRTNASTSRWFSRMNKFNK